VKLYNFGCSYCVVTGCTQDHKEPELSYFVIDLCVFYCVTNNLMHIVRSTHYVNEVVMRKVNLHTVYSALMRLNDSAAGFRLPVTLPKHGQ